MTKNTPRIFISLLLMLLCIGILPVSAFASGGDYPDDTLPAAESSAADTQETKQIGTVTTNGGNLNVRTGAGLDNTAFTQLPNGTVVDVIGRDGDWVKILLPARVGYVYGSYLTVTDAADSTVSIGGITLPFDEKELADLWQLLLGSMTGGSDALTPDGNLTLIDDIGTSTKAGKQFITLESKNGNTFYLIIDRDDEGEETVHFLNQVDEADLMALTGEEETPATCSCTTKCVAGAVNTSCPVCAVNMTECVGKEAKPEVPTEPTEPAAEEPEKKSGVGGILVVLLILALGGGDRRRGTGQRVETTAALRERDDLAQRVRPGQQHADPVPAEGDAAVRRRAVLERLQQEAELVPGLLLGDAEHLEHPLLHVRAVNTDGAATDLVAVADDVVGPGQRVVRVLVEVVGPVRVRRGERVVHRGPLAGADGHVVGVGDRLEHRRVHDPHERPRVVVDQAAVLPDLQPRRAEQRAHGVKVAEVAYGASGRIHHLERGHRYLAQYHGAHALDIAAVVTADEAYPFPLFLDLAPCRGLHHVSLGVRANEAVEFRSVFNSYRFHCFSFRLSARRLSQ